MSSQSHWRHYRLKHTCFSINWLHPRPLKACLPLLRGDHGERGAGGAGKATNAAADGQRPAAAALWRPLGPRGPGQAGPRP
eukprot:scaffold156798_cov34-Prasinocladus_malaysianus.AAC.4